MIGKPITCCTLTEDSPITGIREYPSIFEGVLYVFVMVVAVWFFIKIVDEKEMERRQRNGWRQQYKSSLEGEK